MSEMSDQYKSLVQRYEVREKQWVFWASAVNRSLAQLCVSGNGINPTLDSALFQLRTELSKPLFSTTLHEKVEDIAALMTALKQAQGTQQRAISQTLTQLLECFVQLKVPEAFHIRFKWLEGQLKANPSIQQVDLTLSDLANLWSDLACHADGAENRLVQAQDWRHIIKCMGAIVEHLPQLDLFKEKRD